MHWEIEVVAIYQPDTARTDFFDVPIMSELPSAQNYDAVILSSMEQTTDFIAELESMADSQMLIVPPLLLNMNYRNPTQEINDNNRIKAESTETRQE